MKSRSSDDVMARRVVRIVLGGLGFVVFAGLYEATSGVVHEVADFGVIAGWLLVVSGLAPLVLSRLDRRDQD